MLHAGTQLKHLQNKKKIEIIPSTFSDQKVTKVKITKSGEEINYLESKQHTIK